MSTFTVNCLDGKAHFETVSFDNIEYNSINDYSMTSIEELADNIKKNGLLHNIVLSKQQRKHSFMMDSQKDRKKSSWIPRICKVVEMAEMKYSFVRLRIAISKT